MNINQRIARRLEELRAERGLSVDDLANRSGVSRAMVYRVERAQSSPTATVLDHLATGLGISLTQLFGPAGVREPRLQMRHPVVSRKGQPEWVDPVSGYRRRVLTPSTALAPSTAGQSFQLSELHFPAGTSMTFEPAPGDIAPHQQIWMLRGQLEVRAGPDFTVLSAGDCMAITGDQAIVHRNPGGKEARCLVAVLRSARSGSGRSGNGH